MKLHIDLDEVEAASTAWATRAACRDSDPALFFVEGGSVAQAVRICAGCLVRSECLAYALLAKIDVGVWGGLSAGQRRAQRLQGAAPR